MSMTETSSYPKAISNLFLSGNSREVKSISKPIFRNALIVTSENFSAPPQGLRSEYTKFTFIHISPSTSFIQHVQ